MSTSPPFFTPPFPSLFASLLARVKYHQQNVAHRCLAPAYPDVVAIHATRSTDTVPFLDEIREVAAGSTRQKHESPSAHSTIHPETTMNTDAVARPSQVEQRLRVVLAITGSTAAQKPVLVSEGGGVVASGVGDMVGGRGSALSVVGGRPDVDVLQREVPDIAERKVFMCGPEAFMVAMEGALKRSGVPSSAIHQEEFYF